MGGFGIMINLIIACLVAIVVLLATLYILYIDIIKIRNKNKKLLNELLKNSKKIN